MAADGDEIFYGVTLSSSHPSETFDPEATPGGYPRSNLNRLLIRQLVLGVEAKPEDVNYVQVETTGADGAIKIPIAALKVGETRHVRLDLEFPDPPVTFTLIQGSGPVHITGQHILGEIDEEYDEELEGEMLDDEDGAKPKEGGDSNSQKAKNSKDKADPAKKDAKK